MNERESGTRNFIGIDAEPRRETADKRRLAGSQLA
jgi:hypothetical protein